MTSCDTVHLRFRVHFYVGAKITSQSIAVQMALKGSATFSPRTPEEFLGRDLLRMMNRAATPTSAFQLCVQLGLMKTHENLFAREAGIHNVCFAVPLLLVRRFLDYLSPPPLPLFVRGVEL